MSVVLACKSTAKSNEKLVNQNYASLFLSRMPFSRIAEIFSTCLAAQTVQNAKFSSTRILLMQDWVFRFGVSIYFETRYSAKRLKLYTAFFRRKCIAHVRRRWGPYNGQILVGPGHQHPRRVLWQLFLSRRPETVSKWLHRSRAFSFLLAHDSTTEISSISKYFNQ